MSIRQPQHNSFLSASIPRLFFSQALPMVLVMLMNGLFSLIDTAFLGYYVGSNALTAVSVVFPVIMITIALSSLVSGGMSSLLARYLGAKRFKKATAIFIQAQFLSIFIALSVIAIYWLVGKDLLTFMLKNSATSSIIQMAHTYLLIMIFATPIQFLLSVHADVWRNEGFAGLIALMSIGVTLINIALNYLFIVVLQQGVAGSAYGTFLSQICGLTLLVLLRLTKKDVISFTFTKNTTESAWLHNWREMLALGTPLSLSFIGIALVASTVIFTLSFTNTSQYPQTLASYGIVTRIFGFIFLPLMAIALTTQSIVGNNIGAGLSQRSNATLRLSLMLAFIYCLIIEIGLLATSSVIGKLFVNDATVIAKVDDILTPMIYGYIFVGPILVLALYFQAIGQPLRTAMLTLVKPFCITPLLILTFVFVSDNTTIWYAFPLADILIAIIAFAIVFKIFKNSSLQNGGLQNQHGFGVNSDLKKGDLS